LKKGINTGGKGNGKNSSVQIPTSLRRHYPDQVPGVEVIRLLSANGVGLPQRLIILLLSFYHFNVKRRNSQGLRPGWNDGMLEYWNNGSVNTEMLGD